MKLDIRKQHCTAFCNYGVKRSGTFDSIELHTIGCAQNTASAIRNNMNQHSPSGIVHAIVDAETEGLVLEILPYYNVAWADAGKGNRCSYTIEIAESDYMRYTGGANYVVTDRAKFNADMIRGYNTAVYYVANKCKEFGFDPLKKTSDGLYTVYSHREANLKGLASGHVDPTHIWDPLGWSMDKFRADVKKVMNGENVSVTIGSSSATTTATTSTMYYVRKSWDNKSSQLGAYSIVENAKKICDQNKGYFVFDSNGKAVYPTETATIQKNETVTTVKPETKGTQSSDLAKLSDAEAAQKLLEITRPIALAHNLFPSVIAAQCCLESGFGHTTKLSSYNNIAGMKCELINSQWSGSSWDGKSKVEIYTPEDYGNGIEYIYDYFRVYDCIEDCINDICSFFSTLPKYVNAGVMNAKNYKEQITIEWECHYATDKNYVSKVCNLIEKYHLDKYDSEKKSYVAPTTPSTTSTDNNYYVRKSFSDKSSQLGCFSVLQNAKKLCDQNPLYCVFDSKGNQIYPEPTKTQNNPITTSSDRYVVATAYSNNTFTNKHNTFNTLSNAKKDADNAYEFNKKKYYVYDTKDNYKVIYTSKEKSLQVKMVEMAYEFQKILEADHKAGKYYTYQNKGYKQTIDEARSSGNRTTNCVITVNWLLKKLGLCTDGLLNCKYDGTTGWTLSRKAKTELPPYFDFIKIEGKLSDLIKQKKIYPADIIIFQDHMQMYIDENTALDGGRGNVKGSCVGGKFEFFVGRNPSLGKTVGYVVRPKGAVLNPFEYSDFTSYQVKVNHEALNVRKEPNAKCDIVTTIKDKGIYTIVDEKDGWGLLLSYEKGRNGWIKLSYTTKV